jgi:hypothetical protein
MDKSKRIKNRRVILIRNIFSNSNKFDKYLDVQFIPDLMIVRTLNFIWTSGTVNGVSVRCNLPFIFDNEIFSFSSSSNSPMNTLVEIPHELSRQPIQGSYTFSFQLYDGTLPTLSGRIGFALEFIEYEK